ncbi:MAG: TPM domain-containing protein [Proteobacteria bacterium]|nr:TPM domain-containing protein [Pseudomonadota bacterium]
MSLLLLILSVYPKVGVAQFQIPALTSPVMDQANVIDGVTSRQLSATLQSLYDSGGPQISVLTIPSLNGISIEEASIKVVDEWKLGRKGIDDGVLLFIVPPERKIRIEVGKGLEGHLTDALSRRIIRESITPHFKNQDFSTGIRNGVNQIISVTSPDFAKQNGVYAERRSSRRNLSGDSESSMARKFLSLFFIALIILIAVFRKILSIFGLIPRSSSRHHSGWSGGFGQGGSSGWSSGGGSHWSGGGGGFSGGGSSDSW